ncbi:hypothetical protein RND71_031185 [Anisodus tanguticus]|uniref:DUF4283 domain-containing protein n=1 Tax=Anisodus tanguticus TaxID=243964 RepID=A0AAE1V5C1_9SOLA|nr:hypothetical protein RND71_031185 [Anisodus tanguticus]
MVVTKEDSLLKTSSTTDDRSILSRCLVGRFCGGEDARVRNEVRNWAQQTWKGAQNVQVYDMNGFLFQFEFQTRNDAEHVIMGEWRRQVSILKLNWWLPTKGTYPEETRFDWFWINIKFTEPFSEFINLGLGDSSKPFQHSVIDKEMEKHMQMAPEVHNQRNF